MKNFLKKLFGFSLGPVAGALISFITIPVTTYFIDPSEFGKASMFTVVQSMVLVFAYLGIDQAYTKEYHYEENKKLLFQNSLLMPLFISFLMAVVIFIFQKSFSELLFDNPSYGNISNLFSAMIIFSVIERFILLSIRMQEKAIQYSFCSIMIKLIIFLFTVGLIVFWKRNFLTIVYSTAFGQILGDVLLIIFYRNLFNFHGFILKKELIKKLLIFGLPIVIAASLSNFLNTISRFFLRGYSTYHDLGIYNAALKISNILQIIQVAFTSFWVPTAYRWNKQKKDIKHFSFVGDVLLLLMTIALFSLLIFKKLIIPLLSAEYSEAQYIIGLLALVPFLYTLSETTTLGIVFSGKSFYNILVSLISLVPALFLNYFLVPKYGTYGAAIATAIAYVAFYMSRTYFSIKCGFNIEFMKQVINIIIFFLASLINIFDNPFVLIGTILLMLISLLTQIRIIKTVKFIRKNPNEWDFN